MRARTVEIAQQMVLALLVLALSGSSEARVVDRAHSANLKNASLETSAFSRSLLPDDPASSAAISGDPTPSPDRVATLDTPDAEDAPPTKLPPLDVRRVTQLALERPFLKSVVVAPPGVDHPLPLVIATHGNFERGEVECDTWFRVFQDRAIVLCPRGALAPASPHGDKHYTYLDATTLEQEIDAGIAALRRSVYAPYLDSGKPIFAGFSLGAIMGVGVAKRRASDFSAFIFVEGGLEFMDQEFMTRILETGDKRMMLVCSQSTCSARTRKLAQRMTLAGGFGLGVDVGQFGHRFEKTLAAGVANRLPDFLEDLPRFALAPRIAPADPFSPPRL